VFFKFAKLIYNLGLKVKNGKFQAIFEHHKRLESVYLNKFYELEIYLALSVKPLRS